MYLLAKDNHNHFQYNSLLLISFMCITSLFFILFQKNDYLTITPKVKKIKTVKNISITITPTPIIKKEIIEKPIVKKAVIEKIVQKPVIEKKIIQKPIVKKTIIKEVKKVKPKSIQKPTPIKEEIIKQLPKQTPLKNIPKKKVTQTKKAPVAPILDAQKKASFIAGLYEILDENKFYPKMAKRRKLEGVVEVGFTLEKNGNIKDVFLHQSCGHKILDKAALKVVRIIDSYKHIPDDISMTSLYLKIPIKYSRS